MAQGGSAPQGAEVPSPVVVARRSRFLGEKYADISKLRERAAREEHRAQRLHQRISRLNTRIDKLHHQATVLRERAGRAASTIEPLEREIGERSAEVERVRSGEAAGYLGSDGTALQYRLRKLQQKVEDAKTRARGLELRAAQKTQKTAEIKVKVDQLLELARVREEEAAQLRQRADRLQIVTEQETPGGPTPSSASPSAPAGPSGGPPSSP